MVNKTKQMSQMENYIFTLLKLGIGTISAEEEAVGELKNLTINQWKDLMSLAEVQGVAAIIFDGIQKVYAKNQKEMVAIKESPSEWMQFVFECTGVMAQYEQRSKQQKEVVSRLSEIWDGENIRMMVFKGQANAALYPIPEHRATGDIDCWLFGDAEKGDEVIKQHGAAVDFNWYRHSKISFMDETIENHRVMSHTRGSKKHKEMEYELREMANAVKLLAIDGCGKALMPSAQFNACFLTYHGLHHFLSEGLRMKQILDWAVFLQKEQDKVNWPQFNEFCQRYKLDKFAAVMNYIALEMLGVELSSPHIKTDGTYANKVISSTLYDDDYLFNSGKSDWAVRWLLVKNMFIRDRWKYHDVAQQNIMKQLWQNAVGFVFDRE